ncbi:Rrf2 family transcriptional regulator [Elizabethkingia anophelis]|uniref:Rrf2 family transcriptional regulator n=1 Tax=Elizabethkingia anophelis TaxID=1117645 RepID=A0A494JAR6_9FLAO|nr:Rrf2 family transcriptional regulator [Elizabethkingia anophelis]AQX52186.1 Rrf2 family transcriptional regulator [Elizabethkingia anophelis]MCT4198032.1 Rrf2 family transcriptional regulator [Elizabethkingia anophelis]MCT4226726.1 Rrf2 family transcriptional regulator [Elizabethkingia anophelis]MCT4308319.1 Rrf2 family transcriptional regulator [Elizabethkingia anophelis]MDV2470896.1 Rrf2 family transcriptional regulator [Elizabethkingia anophelis]
MLNNLRFATAIHILILLEKNPEVWMSSEYIAGSINVNPVVVRKEIKNLKALGYIQSKEGKGGGAKLATDAGKITLAAIYRSVSEDQKGKLNSPNPACSVGRQINEHLTDLYEEINRKTEEVLGQYTLENYSKQFK